MNVEEILAMKAGRLLDSAVAEGMMSIKVEYPFASGYPYYLREDKDGQMKYDSVPSYSTDISAAWQIWQQLKFEDAFADALIKVLHILSSFGVRDEIRFLVQEIAPEAICKAALLTKWLENRRKGGTK